MVNKRKNYPSLYSTFNLGDRVKRIYKDRNGHNNEYKGIVLAINCDGAKIYWDTKDGNYIPNDMEIAFSNCPKQEIFKGSEHYSPIKKDKG